MPESPEPGYLEGRRDTWLKLLYLCLTELGVDESTSAYLTGVAGSADPRRQMVVRRIEQADELYHFYGPDPSFYVSAPKTGLNMLTLLGRTITYIPDGPTHGWLVADSPEG